MVRSGCDAGLWSLQFDVNHDKREDMEEFIAMLCAAWT
jgi:hypothetical protein